MKAEPRFFIDHGMIHDRVTGKHVTTDEDSVFCDGINACCALLNELAALEAVSSTRDGEIERLRATLERVHRFADKLDNHSLTAMSWITTELRQALNQGTDNVG